MLKKLVFFFSYVTTMTQTKTEKQRTGSCLIKQIVYLHYDPTKQYFPSMGIYPRVYASLLLPKS